jgi:hypothetical protein
MKKRGVTLFPFGNRVTPPVFPGRTSAIVAAIREESLPDRAAPQTDSTKHLIRLKAQLSDIRNS